MPSPQNQNPVDYFNRYEEPINHGGHEKLRRCLRKTKIALSLILSVLLLCTSVLLMYLIYVWNKPPEIRIESITTANSHNITDYGNNNSTISSDWLLTFNLNNPNLLASIRYKMIRVSVFYEGNNKRRLSSGNLDSFYQNKWEDGALMVVEIPGIIRPMENNNQTVVSFKLDAVVLFQNKLYIKNHWQLLEASCAKNIVGQWTRLVFDGSDRCDVKIQ